jgi:hypothetical protein
MVIKKFYLKKSINTKKLKSKQEIISKYKADLINAMERDKIYLINYHPRCFRKLNIPRQYISEVLNEHMNTNFQDFINEYRVEEFINRLKTTKTIILHF